MARAKSAVHVERLANRYYHVFAPEITPEDEAAICSLAGVLHASGPGAALFVRINPCYDEHEVVREVRVYFLEKGLPEEKETP